MSNTNCKNIENCYSCYSCDFCYSCNSCNSCNSCDFCNFCNFCDFCDFCNSCDFCDSCNFCNSCDFCDSCNFCNSCEFCSGLRMSEKMIFCLGEGEYESKGSGYQKNLQIFNKDVSEEEYDLAKNAIYVKDFKLPISTWVDVKDIENPTTTQKQLGGYLKVLSYKDAWKKLWSTLSSEDKNFFKTFKNFDADIFEQITGIKVEEEHTLSGKEVSVTLDGKTYTAIIK